VFVRSAALVTRKGAVIPARDPPRPIEDGGGGDKRGGVESGR
jgi:hypothetical protein